MIYSRECIVQNGGHMTEFDIYMQLGNQLEKENKILMAYAAFTEAMEKAREQEKELIDIYIVNLAKRLSKVAEERNKELKEQLLYWIKIGEVSFAITCLKNIVEHLKGKDWIDTENAILYQCLSVYQLEVSQGAKPWKIEGKNMEEIKVWYYHLKFMIRRIDMGISEVDELVEYVKRENISPIAFYYMSITMCYFPQRVYGYLVNVFRQYGMKEYAAFFEKLWDGETEEIILHKRESENNVNAKVAFIMAVNEEEIYQEAVYYIEHLKIPANLEIEIIPIRGANSITSAYNQGMGMTDAKYKVYMHQDVMIVNPYMLYEMCNIFQNEEIGMIGVAGITYMPESGIWWDDQEGDIYCKVYQDIIMEHNLSYGNIIAREYKTVKVIDGLIMVTQYDIPWREDLFQGWHFYDISQSLEFQKKGYKIVVPKQDNIWCMHEQKWNKKYAKEYLEIRESFLQEYNEMLGKEWKVEE